MWPQNIWQNKLYPYMIPEILTYKLHNCINVGLWEDITFLITKEYLPFKDLLSDKYDYMIILLILTSVYHKSFPLNNILNFITYDEMSCHKVIYSCSMLSKIVLKFYKRLYKLFFEKFFKVKSHSDEKKCCYRLLVVSTTERMMNQKIEDFKSYLKLEK